MRIDDRIFDALLILGHRRILNWQVVNSLELWNKGLFRTYTEVLTVILKYSRTGCDTMGCNAIETKIGKDLPNLNSKSELKSFR